MLIGQYDYLMKKILHSALFACSLFTALTAFANDQGLEAAIAGKQRSEENALRDPVRHPYETLRFFGIKPNMTVVEIWPGGGWYTEILAPYLRNDGLLIAAENNPESDDPEERRAAQILVRKFSKNPEIYDKVKMASFNPIGAYASPGSVDVVLTFRNVHNWIAKFDEPTLKKIFANMYTSLKPGGVLGVVEHRLPESVVQDAKASTGYVHPSFVIKLAEGAGFKLAEQSDINANPKDNANHKGGVWALPPSYANHDVDHAMYAAIGESDRMTLKFVKPK
jgi:predicted methyltransferase